MDDLKSQISEFITRKNQGRELTAYQDCLLSCGKIDVQLIGDVVFEEWNGINPIMVSGAFLRDFNPDMVKRISDDIYQTQRYILTLVQEFLLEDAYAFNVTEIE